MCVRAFGVCLCLSVSKQACVRPDQRGILSQCETVASAVTLLGKL